MALDTVGRQYADNLFQQRMEEILKEQLTELTRVRQDHAARNKATHVVGHVTENPPNSGIYTMHVVEGTAAQLFSGTLNPEYACTLANTTANPPNGPGNTVQVDCMFIRLGGGTGSDTDTGAVVNITGPN